MVRLLGQISLLGAMLVAITSMVRPARSQEPAAPKAGVVIVATDGWALSDTGFNLSPSGAAAKLANNVASYLTGADRGRILIYSSSRAFGPQCKAALTRGGWEVTQSLRPGALSRYDAVFVGGDAGVDRDAITRYVAGGGRLYLNVGTYAFEEEDAFWNAFLSPLGMELEDVLSWKPFLLRGFKNSPLFVGVDSIYVKEPRGILMLPPKPNQPRYVKVLATEPAIQDCPILARVRATEVALWAIYRTAPEPLAATAANTQVWSVNGHAYAAIEAGKIDAGEAYRQATAMTYQGKRGHLVTITSAAEQDWIVKTFPDAVEGSYIIGAYQDRGAPDYKEPRGGWRWVTGEPWGFTAWGAIEPNNAEGMEDVACLYRGGPWNDFAAKDPRAGFVVEFE